MSRSAPQVSGNYLCYYTTRERKLTYEMVIIGITLQFSSEKSVQYLLCSRPWESPMICQKIIVGCTINLLFNSLSVLGCMQSGKLICLCSYFLYIPLPILCHYLYFYRFIFLQCFLVVQTLFVYLLKGGFQKSSVSRFTEGFNFSLVLHLPWYFCERSCSPYPSI